MDLSPRVSVCGSGRQHSGQGSCQGLARKGLRTCSVQQGRASSGWCQGRLVWCGAALRCVGLGSLGSGLQHASIIPMRVVHSTLLGLFDEYLGILDTKWQFSPGAYGWYMAALLDTPVGKYGISPGAYLWGVLLCGHSCSDHMCRYLRCVSLPDVSALT